MDIEITIQPRGRSKKVSEPPGPRIPRITRLMALAIKFQDMVHRREVADFADLARLGYVTRARLTQIMNLLLLAPKIQEEVLLMSGGPAEKQAVSERDVRPVTRIAEWKNQMRAWDRLRKTEGKPSVR